jgi:hypothetical protein
MTSQTPCAMPKAIYIYRTAPMRVYPPIVPYIVVIASPHAMLPARPKNSAWAASCSVQIPTFFILRFLTVRSSSTSRAKASYI